MVPAVAAAEVPFVVMHWRGFSDTMNSLAVYDDVVTEVLGELRVRLEAVVDGGVDPDRIVIDPGLGFAKLAPTTSPSSPTSPSSTPSAAPPRRRLPQTLPRPRPRPRGRRPAPARERDAATAAVSALAAHAGAWAVRVHEVRATADAVRVARAIEGAR